MSSYNTSSSNPFFLRPFSSGPTAAPPLGIRDETGVLASLCAAAVRSQTSNPIRPTPPPGPPVSRAAAHLLGSAALTYRSPAAASRLHLPPPLPSPSTISHLSAGCSPCPPPLPEPPNPPRNPIHLRSLPADVVCETFVISTSDLLSKEHLGTLGKPAKSHELGAYSIIPHSWSTHQSSYHAHVSPSYRTHFVLP